MTFDLSEHPDLYKTWTIRNVVQSATWQIAQVLRSSRCPDKSRVTSESNLAKLAGLTQPLSLVVPGSRFPRLREKPKHVRP